MNKIITIRGTNGSGKSWLVRQLMDRYPFNIVEVNPKNGFPIVYHNSSLNMFILGDYRSHLNAPGCDVMSTTVVEILANLQRLNQTGHVVFEGVTTAATYGRYADLAKQLPSGAFIWCFIDTPLDICIQRIYSRNGGKPIKEHKVAAMIRQISTQPGKAKAEGWPVYMIDHQKAWGSFMEMLDNEDIISTN